MDIEELKDKIWETNSMEDCEKLAKEFAVMVLEARIEEQKNCKKDWADVTGMYSPRTQRRIADLESQKQSLLNQ